jgi:hypothetical protein
MSPAQSLKKLSTQVMVDSIVESYAYSGSFLGLEILVLRLTKQQKCETRVTMIYTIRSIVAIQHPPFYSQLCMCKMN